MITPKELDRNWRLSKKVEAKPENVEVLKVEAMLGMTAFGEVVFRMSEEENKFYISFYVPKLTDHEMRELNKVDGFGKKTSNCFRKMWPALFDKATTKIEPTDTPNRVSVTREPSR